jgi:hypothetical protein
VNSFIVREKPRPQKEKNGKFDFIKIKTFMHQRTLSRNKRNTHTVGENILSE